MAKTLDGVGYFLDTERFVYTNSRTDIVQSAQVNEKFKLTPIFEMFQFCSDRTGIGSERVGRVYLGMVTEH